MIKITYITQVGSKMKEKTHVCYKREVETFLRAMKGIITITAFYENRYGKWNILPQGWE